MICGKQSSPGFMGCMYVNSLVEFLLILCGNGWGDKTMPVLMRRYKSILVLSWH